MTELRVEIISVGREVLDGRVVDTNSAFLGEELQRLGATPRFGQRVDDQMDRIVSAFQTASQRSDWILVTGGLGPTSDDITAAAFARYAGIQVERNPEALAMVTAAFERMQRPLREVQHKQADIPRGARPLSNPEGTAPGFAIQEGGRHWYFMPGVPREMKRIFRDHILPALPRREGWSTSWATQFTSEGALQEKLSELERSLPAGFEVTYRTRFPENHIGLIGSGSRPAFDQARSRIEAILGSEAYFRADHHSGERLREIEDLTLESCRSAGWKVATVESCTGGGVAQKLTDVAGSSDVVWGGWVVYDNAAKIQLGVDARIIEKHGAVSRECAAALAEGGLRKMLAAGVKTGACVSTTGVAGPSGGSEAKPVGLCYVGLAVSRNGKIDVAVDEARGVRGLDRGRYRTFFTQKALNALRVRATTGS